MIAVASAGVLPAIVLAGRLQRDSAVATEAAIIASARLERLKAAAAAGQGPGGSLDVETGGWYVLVDRAGEEVAAERAVYECRLRLLPAASPSVLVAAVRVSLRGQPEAALTLSTAVHDE